MRNIVLKKKYAKTRFVGDTIQVSLHNVKDLSPHDGEYLSFGLSLYEANITLDHCKWGMSSWERWSRALLLALLSLSCSLRDCVQVRRFEPFEAGTFSVPRNESGEQWQSSRRSRAKRRQATTDSLSIRRQPPLLAESHRPLLIAIKEM